VVILKVKPVVSDEYIRKGLEKSLPIRHHGLIPENEKAVQIGKEIIKQLHSI
jgi:2-oxoglutarate ferredoxin oxidoreductase subunit gamma